VNLSQLESPSWGLMLGFTLVASRVGGFVAGCPQFMPEAVNRTFRVWCVVVLSLVLFFSMPPFALPEQPIMALILEIAYGLVMGLAVRLSILAVYFAGEIIDLNAGYNFSQQINPMTMESTGPIQHLSQLCAGLIFFAVGGQHLVILGLAKSLQQVHAGAVRWQPGIAAVLVAQTTQLFIEGLRIAAPILAALLATQVFMALLSRVAPQLNIWGVGFAAIAAVAVLGFMSFIPAWVDHVARIWEHTADHMLLMWSV
jgi:flagellar biosynthetic protein FliR